MLSVIIGLIIASVIIVFPNKFFPNLFPTYIQTIKANWGISLPKPTHITTIKNSRGGMQGDGTAITELQYKNQNDIQSIKNSSNSWVNFDTFIKEKNKFNPPMQKLLNNIDKNARYFYLKKNGTDYVVFQLQGHTLIVYESYF